MPNFFDSLAAGGWGGDAPAGVVRKKIAINLLDEGDKQYREAFSPEHVELLKTSISDQGFAGVVWVYPKAEGRFGIISGHTSTHAAKQAGEKEVDCAVFDGLTPRKLAKLSYLGNSSHKALNPIEDTNGILDNLRESWIDDGGDPAADMITLLQRTETFVRGRSAACEMSPEFVEGVFKELGVRIALRSFIRDRIPLLSLDAELMACVKDGSLAPNAALVISRCTDPEERAALLAEALEGGLSVSKIRQRVSATKTSPRSSPPPLVARYKAIGKQLQEAKLEGDRATKVERAIAELEALLK